MEKAWDFQKTQILLINTRKTEALHSFVFLYSSSRYSSGTSPANTSCVPTLFVRTFFSVFHSGHDGNFKSVG